MKTKITDGPRGRAVALLSGGLDSTLAIRMMKEKGIEVLAVNFTSPFCLCNRKKGCGNIAKLVAQRLGIQVKTISLGKDYVDVLRNPKHGYGGNMNPCLDCRVLMFRNAKRYMEETGSSFIITGEVLDQRPMSQRGRAIATIEKDAGVERLVVRPLSGGLLPPTLAEEAGLIKREWLRKIRGRSRKPQIALADDFGIDYFACPAGGCLLTDPCFAPRVRDLLGHSGTILVNDLRLLRYGRHFRVSPVTKVIVGRCEEENLILERLARPDDLVLETLGHPGPLTVVRGSPTPHEKHMAGRLHARYSDNPVGHEVRVRYGLKRDYPFSGTCLRVLPASEKEVEKLRI